MRKAKTDPSGKQKEWKRSARKVIKTHYLLFVILCVISVLYCNEFGFVKLQAQEGYNLMTAQAIELGGES